MRRPTNLANLRVYEPATTLRVPRNSVVGPQAATVTSYAVSMRPEADGYHEVHDVNAPCPHLPDPNLRCELYDKADGLHAVRVAQIIYPRSRPCPLCCPDCHEAWDAQQMHRES